MATNNAIPVKVNWKCKLELNDLLLILQHLTLQNRPQSTPVISFKAPAASGSLPLAQPSRAPAAPDPQPVNVVLSSKPAKEHKDLSPTTGHTTIDSDSQENNNDEVALEEEKKSESHDLTYIAQDLTKASESSKDEAEVPSSTIAPVARETTPLAPGITQVVAKTAKHKQAEPKR